jgi:nifR3 family TIM-barrel protein
VTVKFRSGWDDSSINAVEFAKRMEDAGAAMLTVHGRTRMQMYRPPVNLEIIRAVKQAVSVPVCGNGGVDSIESYLQMQSFTGCDLVMIGQASYGNPWLFAQIRHYLETGERLPMPTLEEKLQVMEKHVRLVCENVGEKQGMRICRRQSSFYLKGLHGAPQLRKACGQLTSLADLEALLALVRQLNPQQA